MTAATAATVAATATVAAALARPDSPTVDPDDQFVVVSVNSCRKRSPREGWSAW